MATSLIIGERGEGKTTLAMYLAKQYSKVVIMFEPKPDETVEGKTRYVFTDVELYHELQCAKDSGEALIAYIPQDDVAEGFSEFCDVLKSGDPRVPYAFGGVSIVIDEAWSLMTANTSHPDLEKLLRIAPRAGDYKIDVFVLAHRPRDINPRTHTFSDALYVFRMSEKKDLDVLAENWNSKIADTVYNFPDGKHYCCKYNKNTRVVEVIEPTIWKP